MYYTLLIILILTYMYLISIDNVDEKKFFKTFFPVFLMLFITFAIQYEVGTDYASYLQAATNNELGIFKLNQFINDKEYLFAIIVKISQLVGWPQIIFFIVSFIQTSLFAFSLKEIKRQSLSITTFMFFYFFLSLSFFNQFNGIRQYISIQLVFFAFLKLLSGKKALPIFLLLSSIFFHKSSIIIFIFIGIFYLFCRIEKFELFCNKKIIYIGGVLCLFVYFIDFNSIIIFIAKYLNFFSEYSNSAYVKKMNFIEIITKLVKLVVIFYCIYRIDLKKLTKNEKILYLIGSVASLVMILSFSSSIIWRIYLFFDLFTIFPPLLFFKNDANKIEKKMIVMYLILFLAMKILIMPRGEYLYRCILWR